MPHAPRVAVLAIVVAVLTTAVPASGQASADPCSRADAIVGTSGKDFLLGTTGDDVICGLGGRDTIDGLAGNDTIVGGDGDDDLYGRAGDDLLTGGAGADRLDGGGGLDTVSYAERTTGVTVTLVPPADGIGDDGEPGERDRADLGIEHVTGGAGDDHLTGDAAANTLQGGGGADRLTGAGGADQLVGSTGDDTLDGGGAADAVRCGLNTDRYTFDATDSRIGCEHNLTPATGNLVIGIGDSNMATGQQGYFPDTVPSGLPFAAWPGYVDTFSILGQATALAAGRSLYGGTLGQAGAFTATIFGDQLTRALALRPTAIAVVAGTNNITAGGSYIAGAKADYQAGVARMVAAGVTPILTTVLPRNDGREAAVIDFNAWLRDWAAQHGYALADFHSVLADGTGRFKPGTNRDALHLAEPGVDLAATELTRAIRLALPAVDAMLALEQGANLPAGAVFANPLFLDDANGDGRPDGVAGSTALSVSTTTDPAHAAGRLLKAVHTGTDTSANVSIPAAPGRRIYLAGRLRSKVQASGGLVQVRAYARPSGTLLWELRLGRDLPTGAALPPLSFTVPASPTSTTSVQLAFGLKGGGQFELGQLTAVDVTAP